MRSLEHKLLPVNMGTMECGFLGRVIPKRCYNPVDYIPHFHYSEILKSQYGCRLSLKRVVLVLSHIPVLITTVFLKVR
jgi:hypothetical protein